MGTKYIIYQCDVCARQTEIELDPNRPDPVRCNITLRCRGKLVRRGQSSVKHYLFTPIVPGLIDYVPRGTLSVPGATLVEPIQVPIFTAGGEGLLTMAVIRAQTVGSDVNYYVLDEDGNQASLELVPSSQVIPFSSYVNLCLYEVTPELLQYTRYIYLRAGFTQVINGPDSSTEQRNLRFNQANSLRVYVNGLELDPSLYDSTVDNQITFTPAITDPSNVIEIFVYNDVTAGLDVTTLIRLKFSSLSITDPTELPLRELSCWGDYASMRSEGVDRYLMFCTDLSALGADKIYATAWVEAVADDGVTTYRVGHDEALILLGREPFAPQDKELHAYVSATNLIDDQAILSYQESTATGAIQLTISSDKLTQVYNSLMGTNKLSLVAITQTTDETSQGTEALKRKYILGPS